MSISLAERRRRGFRPVAYNTKHRIVACLHACGARRASIARAVGYSRWHVSRILGMVEAQRDVDRISRDFTSWLVKGVLHDFAQRAALTRRKERHGAAPSS